VPNGSCGCGGGPGADMLKCCWGAALAIGCCGGKAEDVEEGFKVRFEPGEVEGLLKEGGRCRQPSDSV
jgi:hypothetical protein